MSLLLLAGIVWKFVRWQNIVDENSVLYTPLGYKYYTTKCCTSTVQIKLDPFNLFYTYLRNMA